MAAPVPPLRQPPGSNSCLPTAVLAVLLRYELDVSVEEVSLWCRETPDGCWLDDAMDGLREAGLDVEDLSGTSVEEIRSRVAAEADPQPVIVTLKDPFVPSGYDHAVVITDVSESPDGDDTIAGVDFMDPLIGRMEQDESGAFWDRWDFGGNRAFAVRP